MGRKLFPRSKNHLDQYPPSLASLDDFPALERSKKNEALSILVENVAENGRCLACNWSQCHCETSEESFSFFAHL